MTWSVEGTDQFADWYWGLDRDQQEAVNAAIEVLEERGPALGRPLAGEIDTSRERREGRVHNMKELRPSTSLRILFVFDPRRTAIMLVGGDKSGRWQDWYAEMVPVAESLYAEYLADLTKEGVLK
jgi:hypothetical protein